MMKNRVFYLDFIRAISICLIIIFHFNSHALEMHVSDNAIFWMGSTANHNVLGVAGISLFIILSGASLMLSTKEKFDAKIFFRKRFLSIYPLFWVTYSVCFVLLFLIHPNYRNAVLNFPHPSTFLLTVTGFDGYLLYAIPNFYILGEWFLGFIIIMYLLFPILRCLFLKNAFLTVLLCFFITFLVTRFYNLELDINKFPLFRLNEFVLGMGFIYIFKSSHRPLNLFLIVTASLLFYLSVSADIPWSVHLTAQGISIFTCLAVISELFMNSPFAGLVKFVSAYSFGAFLLHHVILFEILPTFQGRHLSVFNSYLFFFLLLSVVYGLSYVLTKVTFFGLRKIASPDRQGQTAPA